MMPHDRMSAITLCVSDPTQNNRQTARREKAGLAVIVLSGFDSMD